MKGKQPREKWWVEFLTKQKGPKVRPNWENEMDIKKASVAGAE